MAITSIKAELDSLGRPERAKVSKTFFKTGPGEYGEGDEFIGITVPDTRVVAKKYLLLPFGEVEELLNSRIHEYRLCALLILVYRFDKYPEDRQRIYEFYLSHTTQINNWDLVDVTSPNIVGEYLQARPRKKLYELSRSKNLWEKRIAIVSTYAFIKKHQFADTLAISEILLHDKHDLIHKAIGWMLREVGKRSKASLQEFLRKHAATMPRTTLRYAIERMSPQERKRWMNIGKGKESTPKTEVFSHKKSLMFERISRK